MSNFQSEMKVPIRPAPPPPHPLNHKFQLTARSEWDNLGKESWKAVAAPTQKKKPPPRPPPPNLGNKKLAPSRPSQLIAGLFRKNNGNGKANDVFKSKPARDATTDLKENNGLLLIDFTSPPSSPTLTARSSNDALSLNSFGSDGLTPGSGSSGNTSNVESGFEDDFDQCPGESQKSDTIPARDPWSPLPKATDLKNFSVGKSWVAFPSQSSSKKNSIAASTMPTIIRSKPEGHKPQSKVGNCDLRSTLCETEVFHSSPSINAKSDFDIYFSEKEDDDNALSESPPMPTCPPPPPPPEFRAHLQSLQNMGFAGKRPYGIALYDYPGEQSDDLSFKKNEVINLVRRIDENWLVGQKDGQEGSVPANFITIRVPLPEEESIFVTALYPFRSEAWNDLDFVQGSVIKVTHAVDQNWLFGECDGRSGQFPANFVDRVPTGLPKYITESHIS